MTKEQLNFRIDSSTKEKLQEIADLESKKTGYDISMSSLINKILKEYADNYKEKK